MVFYTISDCEADVTAGCLRGQPAVNRAAMLAAIVFLRAIDRAISAAHPVIVCALEDLARDAGLSVPEYRLWLARHTQTYDIPEVLAHRVQVTGQPVLILD